MADKRTSSNIADKAKEALKKSGFDVGEDPKVEAVEKDLSKASIEDQKEPGDVQFHLAPKWMRKDRTYFPGCRPDLANIQVMDHGTGLMRPLGLPNEYRYQFWPFDAIDEAMVEGWKFCRYKGGSLSGLASGGFSNTGLYEEEAVTGRVKLGDCYLMYMDVRLAEELDKEHEDLANKLQAKPATDYFNDAYRTGIRAFTEDEQGQRTYN